MFLRSEGAKARSVASKLFAKQDDYATRVGGIAASNLSFSANKKGTFVYQKFLFCLSKPQAWYIIAARSAVYIISPLGAVSHHASACIPLRLDDIQTVGLMIYRNNLRMIYKAYALIYLRKYGIINSPINKNLQEHSKN